MISWYISSTVGVYAQSSNEGNDNNCIRSSTYNDRNTITITCTKPTALTGIDNAIQNPELLEK